MIAPRWLARVLIWTYLTVISGGCVLFLEEDGDEEETIITYTIRYSRPAVRLRPGKTIAVFVAGGCSVKGDGVCSFEEALPFTLQVPFGSSQELSATLFPAVSGLAARLVLENIVTDPLKCGVDETDFLTDSGQAFYASKLLLRFGLARAKPKSRVKNRVFKVLVECL